MTRTDYMQALREKLQNYNQALAQEIIEDYEMHFAEGLAAGQSEDEIIRELGDVDDMLREFTQQELQGETALEEPGSGHTRQYDRLYRAVVIDGSVADICVSPSADRRLRVAYQNDGNTAMKLRYRFYQYEKDGIFYAGVKDTGSKGKHAFFRADHAACSLTLSVEVPDGIPVIKITAASGDIQVKNIALSESEPESETSETKIELRTASGDIEMTGASADIISLKSASGDQDLESVIGKRIMLQCGSGDIDGSEIRCVRLTAHAASGDIELRPDAEICEVRTGSGDMDLTASANSAKLSLTAGSGDVRLDLGNVAGAVIKADTGSGDMTVLGKTISGNCYRDSYGDGACKVEVTTSSGDIDIE